MSSGRSSTEAPRVQAEQDEQEEHRREPGEDANHNRQSEKELVLAQAELLNAGPQGHRH